MKIPNHLQCAAWLDKKSFYLSVNLQALKVLIVFGDSTQIKLEFGSVGFSGEIVPLGFDENQFQPKDWEINLGHIGGRQVLSLNMPSQLPRQNMITVL